MAKYSNLAIAFILLVLSGWMPQVHAQQSGDYRSSGSGNWTDASNWEIFNGTAWIPATNYPGQVAGTNEVFILGGNTISLGSTIPFAVQSLIVGDGTGATDTFEVSNTASLNTPLIDLQTGGFAIWTSNVTLTLPSGAAFILTGGVLDNGNPCSAAKRLVIGSRIYSTCNGGAGADYSFEDLNNGGGSLAVTPSSNSPVCEGTDLTLFANPSGAGSGGATFSWSGTGPGGYSFSSTQQDPMISGLLAGSYSYSITITDSSGFSYTNSISATVLSGVTITTQPSDQQGMPGSTSIFSITASGVSAYQWQVSTDGGFNYSDLSDGAKYSGSQTGVLQVSNIGNQDNGNIFRVQIQASSAGCPLVASDPAVLNVVVTSVISNRRITFRVNN
jgi:hypothetical protein